MYVFVIVFLLSILFYLFFSSPVQFFRLISHSCSLYYSISDSITYFNINLCSLYTCMCVYMYVCICVSFRSPTILPLPSHFNLHHSPLPLTSGSLAGEFQVLFHRVRTYYSAHLQPRLAQDSHSLRGNCRARVSLSHWHQRTRTGYIKGSNAMVMLDSIYMLEEEEEDSVCVVSFW